MGNKNSTEVESSTSLLSRIRQSTRTRLLAGLFLAGFGAIAALLIFQKFQALQTTVVITDISVFQTIP